MAYALFSANKWEATQALVVRDEAAGGPNRPGKFSHSEEMKTVQETLLELVRGRAVLSAALAEVGSRDGLRPTETFPTEADVDSLSANVKLIAPKGAEFGKTEMFYLKVHDRDRGRAVVLAAAICRHLQSRYESLRLAKARGVTGELNKTVSLAQADLDAATERLSAIETEVGGDLAELRTLNEFPTGDSSLRRSVAEIESELRKERAAIQSSTELVSLLKQAQKNPAELLASPSRLLESQPALRRLKDGLVDAQLTTSKLLGSMAESHPLVVAARTAQSEVAKNLHNELSIAICGLEVESRLAGDRLAQLAGQKRDLSQRLTTVASVRASYANLAATVRTRTEILKQAQQELAEARASQAGARLASLITPVDGPMPGTSPLGPGRATILFGGTLAGFACGLGLVFFLFGERTSNTRAANPPAATSSSGRSAKRSYDSATTISIKSALARLSPDRHRLN